MYVKYSYSDLIKKSAYILVKTGYWMCKYHGYSEKQSNLHLDWYDHGLVPLQHCKHMIYWHLE